jgi:hypothetical protein
MFLSNRYIFWTLILSLFIGFTYFSMPQVLNQPPTDSSIDEKSLQTTDSYIVDLNDIDKVQNIDQLKQEKEPLAEFLHTYGSNIYLIFYTAIISILFIYREKQNRLKNILIEKQEDEIKMLEAKQKMPIQENLLNELKQYEALLKPDLMIDTLEEKLHSEPKMLIVTSRIILEKLITNIYACFTSEEATLNDMIVALHRNRKFSHDMNNYAHIIKGFGNTAIHPSKKNPANFNAKDAMLVLGILLQLIKELDKNNLLTDCSNA